MELTLEGGQLWEGLEALDRLLGLHLPRTRVVAVGLRCDDVRAVDGVRVVPRGIQVAGEGGERGQRMFGGVLGCRCAQQRCHSLSRTHTWGLLCGCMHVVAWVYPLAGDQLSVVA